MNYVATVRALGQNIEEEVTLSVGHCEELVCFAPYMPVVPRVGGRYLVGLSLAVFSDYRVVNASGANDSFERLGNGFAYKITGLLTDGCLKSCGLTFIDDVLLRDFGYLDGAMVTVFVDRVDAEFLSNEIE